MILSKPGSLVRLAKIFKSTSAASATSSEAYKIKIAPKEEIDYGKQYEFTPPAADHNKNPYRHFHVPSGNWKYVYYASLPIILGLTIRIIYIEREEEEHIHEHRPEYVPVEYMRIQRSPFPWGDGKHTLFHNPKRNPVPGVGYEA